MWNDLRNHKNDISSSIPTLSWSLFKILYDLFPIPLEHFFSSFSQVDSDSLSVARSPRAQVSHSEQELVMHDNKKILERWKTFISAPEKLFFFFLNLKIYRFFALHTALAAARVRNIALISMLECH